MEIPLSDQDIYHLLDGQVKVITYPEIKMRYRTLEELLKPYNKVVILYNITPNYGHWTCLFKYPTLRGGREVVEMYDPYGGLPDSELSYAKASGDEPYLVKLLYDWSVRTGGTVEFNDKPQQKLAKGVNTCGRHCVFRLVCDSLPLKKYISLFKGLDADQVVTNLTE